MANPLACSVEHNSKPQLAKLLSLFLGHRRLPQQPHGPELLEPNYQDLGKTGPAKAKASWHETLAVITCHRNLQTGAAGAQNLGTWMLRTWERLSNMRTSNRLAALRVAAPVV